MTSTNQTPFIDGLLLEYGNDLKDFSTSTRNDEQVEIYRDGSSIEYGDP